MNEIAIKAKNDDLFFNDLMEMFNPLISKMIKHYIRHISFDQYYHIEEMKQIALIELWRCVEKYQINIGDFVNFYMFCLKKIMRNYVNIVIYNKTIYINDLNKEEFQKLLISRDCDNTSLIDFPTHFSDNDIRDIIDYYILNRDLSPNVIKRIKRRLKEWLKT